VGIVALGERASEYVLLDSTVGGRRTKS